MEFIEGHTYEITGFTKSIDRKTETEFNAMGFAPGGHFKIIRVDNLNIKIRTRHFETTLSKESLELMLLKSR